jgi:DNA-binding MarR family transcriptional regulator
MNQRIKDGFGMVSNIVLRNPELSLGEKAVYSYLCTYADSDSGELFVSLNRIAAELGISHSTVKRHLYTLENKGIVIRLKRGHGMSSITKLIK